MICDTTNSPQANCLKTTTFKQASQRDDFPGWERNLFSSRDWLSVLEKTYRLRLFVKYIKRGDKISSYVLYSVVKNFLEWKICILSYCDYCDCHVSSLEDWQMIFQALRAEYPRYRIAIRNLRDENVRKILELKELSREKFHLLDVREELEILWRRAHDSFKAAVNQAKRSGVVVKRCGKEALPKFYDLHLKIRKYKYRIFPQPYKFFDMIWQQYMTRDRGVLLGAFDPQGKFIGGNVYLICGNTLYYKFNTSSQVALGLRPNNLVFWEGIKFAKERNLQYVDLGSSGLHQKGLILFKDHTGANSQEIIHLGYEPPGYRFSQKRILKVMTSFFTQPWIPEVLVRWGSHLIYPFLA